MTERPAINVVHLGVVGDIPGGIAKVISEHLKWSYEQCNVGAIRTTRGRRDIRALVDWPRALFKLLKLRRRRERSVVVVHLSQGGSFIREGSLLMISQKLGLPASAFIHGSNFVEFTATHTWLVRTVLSHSASIIALTEQTVQAIESLELANVPIMHSRNAVTVPSSIAKKDKTVVFAGEVSTRKGADILLTAWQSLQNEFPDWRLVIAGPIKLSIQEQIPRCTFLGTVRQEVVEDLLAKAEVAVLPSRAEALPMFLLEAMSNECAVIGTDVGQVKELLQDVGLVVSPDSAVEFATAMRQVLSDRQLRAEFAKAGRMLIEERHSASVVVKLFEDHWVDLAYGKVAS